MASSAVPKSVFGSVNLQLYGHSRVLALPRHTFRLAVPQLNSDWGTGACARSLREIAQKRLRRSIQERAAGEDLPELVAYERRGVACNMK
jgi:hypothetical protein